MSDVMDTTAFLAGNAIKIEEHEYVASKRFVKKNGEPIPWKLRVVSNDELDAMVKRCRKREYNPKTREYRLTVDSEKLDLEMVCASVVFPNLNDVTLQESYGTVGAENTVKAMLTPGEYTDLTRAVTEVAGFQMGMEDQVKTAKN